MKFAVCSVLNEELGEIIRSESRSKLAISMVVNGTSETLLLVMGDLKSIEVPLSVFKPNAVSAPDFSHPEIIDYGQTLKFGWYEASTEAVLADVAKGERVE